MIKCQRQGVKAKMKQAQAAAVTQGGTRNSRQSSVQQQFARPLIKVDLTTGHVLIDGIRDFWERQKVKTYNPK